MSDELAEALADMREGDAIAHARRMLGDGTDPAIILRAVRQGMEVVGRRFESGEYFLPELILSGEVVGQISELIKPQLTETRWAEPLGKVVIGTVQGDVHDLGKNIVVFMLEVQGFDVIDLGVDVPPDRFVEAITKHRPQVLGLSALLTVAYGAMQRTVEAIRAAGLYDSVRIMIGGGHTTETVREHVGAHAYGADAVAAVRLARSWVEGS